MSEKKDADKSSVSLVEEFLAAAPRDMDQAEALVEEALLAGAGQAEVYLKTSRTSGLLLHHGFATITGGSERGVALRVFDGKGRWGHAHASWGDPEWGRRQVREALEAMHATSPQAAGDFPPPAPRPDAPLPEIQGLMDERVLRSDPAQRREAIETALRDIAPARAGALGVSLREGIVRVALVNSEGLRVSSHRTLALLALTCEPGDGPSLVSERAACGMGAGEIAQAAVELLELQGAKESEEVPRGALLLRSSAAAALVMGLERRISSTSLEAGGEQALRRVAAEAVTLVDDPLLAEGVCSSPFDGTGFPSRPTVLVDSGRAARREAETGTSMCGRTIRPSYRDLPVAGVTNLVLRPGRRSWENILTGVEHGWMLAVLNRDDPAGMSGERASWTGLGWEVRQGSRTGPCRKFGFEASAQEMLESVREVSDTIRFTLCGSAALGCCDLLLRGEA